MKKKIPIVDEKNYVKLFTKNENSINEISPLRLYKVEVSSKNIQTPTPFFRPTFNCITFIKKGSMKIILDNETKTATEKTLLISKSGHLSATLNFSKNTSGYFIAYEDSILDGLFTEREFYQLQSIEPLIHLVNNEYIWISKLTELIESELNKQDFSLEVALPLFQSFIRKIITLNHTHSSINDKNTKLLFAFKKLINKHHIKHKQISFYAKQLSVSENYLARCVKSSTDKTPKQLLNEKDIEYSKELILHSYDNLAGVALALNYNDPSYFSRLFKKIVGLTPSEFKQLSKHD